MVAVVIAVLLTCLAVVGVAEGEPPWSDNPDYKSPAAVDKPRATFSMATLSELDGVLRPTSKHQILHHFTSFTMPSDLWLVERQIRNEAFYEKHKNEKHWSFTRYAGYPLRKNGVTLYDEKNHVQIAAKYADAPQTGHIVRWVKEQPITVALLIDQNMDLEDFRKWNISFKNDQEQRDYLETVKQIRRDTLRVFERLKPRLEAATGLKLEFVEKPDKDVFYKKYDGDPCKSADITIQFGIKKSCRRHGRARADFDPDDEIAFQAYEVVFPILHSQYNARSIREFYKGGQYLKIIFGVSEIGEDYSIKSSICNARGGPMPEGKILREKFLENCLITALGLRMDSDFYDFDYLMFLLDSLYGMEAGWTYQQYVSPNLMQRVTHSKVEK
tara:strand:- start:588 stop:1745 length:1158 start_codon:yes stop_codon:yes gene_type:complete